jgi:tripartite-type tricarboxylate transporter receptor subunit TctC
MIKPSRRAFIQMSMSAGATIALMSNAGAQAVYPSRAIRVIVPFPPGGGTDIFARLMAQQFAESFKQPCFVENMPGAASNAGTARAAKAPADGYTVLFAFGSFAVNPNLYEKVPYDPIKDFEPVTLAASTTTVLISNPSLPAKTLQELIDLVRKHPEKYSYASGGYGTQAHLVGEQIRLAYNVDLVHVPYQGAWPSVADVAAGHVPIGFTSLAAGLQQIKAGQLRALAVTSPRRSTELQDVPTITELGHPGILGDSSIGVLVPAGTSKEVVAILHREIVRAVARPEIKARLMALGFEPIASSPEAFAESIRTETLT